MCAKPGGVDTVLIRPAKRGGPAAVARLTGAPDLASYARAVTDREALIPAGTLSGQATHIPLPLEPPGRFLAEPYVEASRCARPSAPKPWTCRMNSLMAFFCSDATCAHVTPCRSSLSWLQ